MGQSVNYFANLGAECHFPKLGYSEPNFLKKKGYQCNLSNFKKIVLHFNISSQAQNTAFRLSIV